MAADSLPVEHLFTLSLTAAVDEAYQVRGGPAGRRIIAAVTFMYYGGILVDGQARSAPYFETGDERYSWLNNVQGVGVGSMTPAGPAYEVYALR